MYMPSMALKDSECKELFVESIHQNLANVMEEQEVKPI
jgi:hypothetical protein